MTEPVIKGYCPGALRPMMSGDGLVVRLRPLNGRLTSVQCHGIADLSEQFGNGFLDLSSRANIQLRGISEASYTTLIDRLRALDLVDPTEEVEQRRNIVITPFYAGLDETVALSDRLTQALRGMSSPALPHKFGFAIDTGPVPVLQSASADIRIERDVKGRFILVADGMQYAKPVSFDQCIEEALALAGWFLRHRTTENRMAHLPKSLSPKGFNTPRQNQVYQPTPGPTPWGYLAGFAFGQFSAHALRCMGALGAIHLTPWRMTLIENIQTQPAIDGAITDPNDPLLRVTACPGAPQCAQAFGETRDIARNLAHHLKSDQTLHVSGCAKGCAYPKTAPLTLTATQTGFDLVRQGRAGDTPSQTDLSFPDIIKAL
ncbi:MAG: precorrin-3B synthase [Sulfitobacter sp.]